MSDMILLDIDRATELHAAMGAATWELFIDRSVLAPLLDDATAVLQRDQSEALRPLARATDTMLDLADDLDNRLRMVLLGGPEINAGLWALDRLRQSWLVIDVRGADQAGADGVVSRRDLEWAAENLEGDTADAARWMLDHPEFFNAVETAKNNTTYMGAPAEGIAHDGDDAKMSLADVDSYITKLDTWATLLPWISLIDVAAAGGDADGFMSKDDFEAFLTHNDLPPDVITAAHQVLNDGAFHERDGIGWDVALVFAGFIPVVGELIDASFALYYLSQGDWENAAIHAVGLIIPVAQGGLVRTSRTAARTAFREATEEAVESAAFISRLKQIYDAEQVLRPVVGDMVLTDRRDAAQMKDTYGRN